MPCLPKYHGRYLSAFCVVPIVFFSYSRNHPRLSQSRFTNSKRVAPSQPSSLSLSLSLTRWYSNSLEKKSRVTVRLTMAGPTFETGVSPLLECYVIKEERVVAFWSYVADSAKTIDEGENNRILIKVRSRFRWRKTHYQEEPYGVTVPDMPTQFSPGISPPFPFTINSYSRFPSFRLENLISVFQCCCCDFSRCWFVTSLLFANLSNLQLYPMTQCNGN